MHLVLRLQTSVAGCQWLLDQWANLRTALERDVPWVASDQRRAVRLLGHHPKDVLDNIDVARLYLASHVLLNQGGELFQEIVDELPPAEAQSFRRSLQSRRYEVIAPNDVAAARQELLEIVDLATEPLQKKLEVLSQIAALDARSAAECASWDDSPEGERLRRYEITCSRTWLRMFELLVKMRSRGEELDFDDNRYDRALRSYPQARRKRLLARRPSRMSSPHRWNLPRASIRRSKPNRVRETGAERTQF